jgi:hypothetical protein
MKGYLALEQKTTDRFYSVFEDILPDGSISAGDIDTVIDNMFHYDLTYGLVFEFGGGRNDQDTFSRPHWKWVIEAAFLIKYTGVEIETNMRQLLSRIALVFEGYTTLGGDTPLVRVDVINLPEAVTVDDVPMYWVTFRIDIFDRY